MLKLIDIYNKWGGDAYIEREGRWMKMSEGYCKGWDAKFKKDELYGKIGEDFVAQLIGTDEIKSEVKTERDIWKKTGNIAIELRCKGKPSGVSTTEATVWIHLLAYKGAIEGGFLFKVDELKGKVKKLHKDGNLKIVMGGDDNASQMSLLPIKELF